MAMTADHFTVVALYSPDHYGEPQRTYITWHAMDTLHPHHTQCGQNIPTGSVTRSWDDDVRGPMDNLCGDCQNLYPIVYDGETYPEE
jgi:hypothetical protein